MLDNGETILAAEDADTFCVYTGPEAGLELLNDGKAGEQDLRRACTIFRFATREERDEYVRSLSRGAGGRSAGSKRNDDHAGLAAGLQLTLSAGLSGSEAVFEAEPSGNSVDARYRALFPGESERRAELSVPRDEWARFLAELSLLRVRQWRRYRAKAMDGLLWALCAEPPFSVDAGGANAYPPEGEGPEISPHFLRLLLAVERLLGETFWPEVPFTPALESIGDERDRLEHLILSALRSWAEELRDEGADPSAMTEGMAQKKLVPHLQRLARCRQNVSLVGALEDWAVGPLDLQIGEEEAPIWIELKWCKRADTLHNCLWDAAKVGSGLREGRARYGYLLAGAPAAGWESGKGPSQLFEVSNHRGDSLVRSYPSWWSYWWEENHHTYPVRLPTPVLTLPVGRVRLAVPGGGPWLVRLARVEAPGSATFDAREAALVGG